MKEIKQIITLYDQLKAEGTSCALAVVVDVEQSSYRRIGARLLVAEDGRFIGGISGGCLEGDALKRAKLAMLRGEPSVHTYDTTDGDDAVIGVGLGCEGRIEVAFLPVDYTDPSNEIELLREMLGIRRPKVLVRIIKANFDVPKQHHFTLYTLGQSETLIGYFGQPHGKLMQDTASRVLARGKSQVVSMGAERAGTSNVLFEVIHPQIHLILTGANYDIPATLAAARLLGWKTTVVGPARKFTSAITEMASSFHDYRDVDRVVVDAATAVVLMSHDYDWDRKMVQHFLPLNPAYFGMLGPRKRMMKMDRSLPDLDLAGHPNLYSPVGLDIGAETPEEIAASLIAEIVMVFRGRSGGVLRDRNGSIH